MSFKTKQQFADVISIVEGPCSMDTHLANKQLKCTSNGKILFKFDIKIKIGYFELIQCLDQNDYCVCVNSLTGHEAFETRTKSKQILPHCGLCHSQLAETIKFENSLTQFQNQCDSKTGITIIKNFNF